MQQRVRSILLLLFFLQSFGVSAAVCEVPKFETFDPASTPRNRPDLVAVEYVMQPIASFRIPSGFSKQGSFPYGSVALGKHPDGIVAVLGYETKETLAAYQEKLSPADFMLSIFRGSSTDGCKYLKGQNLAGENYRLHAELDSGVDLFAYGKVGSHRFYLVRKDKPQHVITGQFKNISRAEFETILSTIKIQ